MLVAANNKICQDLHAFEAGRTRLKPPRPAYGHWRLAPYAYLTAMLRRWAELNVDGTRWQFQSRSCNPVQL
eukprot:239698-Chlamydomonas_euryale.AAC.7